MRAWIRDARCIALIGAGGKTTISESLALAFAGSMPRVALTTTTHILLPDALPALLLPTEEEILSGWQRLNPLAVCGAARGMDVQSGRCKTRAPGADTLQFLLHNANRLVIESDGARGRALKLHGENEPVVPKETDLVLIVAGMHALGRPLSEVCHRIERIGPVLGRAETARTNAEDIANAAGAAKCGDCDRKIAILNRVTDENRAQAERAKALLKSRYGIPAVLLPDLPDEPTRRAAIAALLLK